MTSERMQELLNRFPTTKIAVVGDYFLDKYLVIEETLMEVSLETGLDSYQVVGKRLSPGAAGTVTNNLAALEIGEIYAVGFTGDDGEGYELRQGLAKNGVNMEHLVTRPELFTPTYTKPMLQDTEGNESELNRLDIKNRETTSTDLEDKILEHLAAVVKQVQAVIIADQIAQRHLGVITDRVREGIAELAKCNPSVIFFADSRESIGLFREVIIKPNRFEAAKSCGYTGSEEALSAEDALRYGTEVVARNNRPTFVTSGPDGIHVFAETGHTHVPGILVPPPVDIVGAGDSTTSGIVSALCAGASLTEAAVMGNCVASLTIQQLGTTGVATRKQVFAQFDANQVQYSFI